MEPIFYYFITKVTSQIYFDLMGLPNGTLIHLMFTYMICSELYLSLSPLSGLLMQNIDDK